jgi:hypothetical protein
MIITMYWKFGTRGASVAVGVCEAVGKAVNVGESVGLAGTAVDVHVAEGTGVARLGGAEVAQAVNKTNKRVQITNRNIEPL